MPKGVFTSIAGEFLTLAPILLLYLIYVCKPRGQGALYVESMLAVLVVLDLLQAIKRGVRTVSPGQLRETIEAHVKAYRTALREDAIRPKHHYNRHLSDMFRRFGVVITTLTHERKHV